MDYKVSVIVPVYNAENYLHQCVDSLLSQTLKSIQIILVDDGSKDSSGSIIDNFAKRYNNIESYHKENGGSSSARNLGITKAKGEYISFLDSDDWLEKDALEILYAIAEEYKVDIIQFTAFGEIQNTSYYVPRSGYYDNNLMKEELYPHLIPSFTSEGVPTYLRWSNCMRFYKTGLLKNSQISYRVKAITFEDYLFNVETILAAHSYYYYDSNPLYHVVQNPTSKSRNYQPYMLDSCIYIFEKVSGCLSRFNYNDHLFTYVDSALYFADACITNEMLLDSLISNVFRVKKVLRSNMCILLRESDDCPIVGWYGKVLRIIKKNSAIYLVYRYKVRKKMRILYEKIKSIFTFSK